MTSYSETLRTVTHRNLLFIHGKGGVGKTTVSQAIAVALANQNTSAAPDQRQNGDKKSSGNKNAKTLWLTVEDPLYPPGEITQITPSLWHLNCDFTKAFEEYAALKIGMAPLTRLFLQNKLIRYLAKAAPGIHELVLLGKIWHERENYSHIVVDLPSTGYGLAMFQSTQNFVRLFQGGPLNKDAQEMLGTFNNSRETGHLIVSLPEEMPLRESLDLHTFLIGMFPKNPAGFIVNRLFPKFTATPTSEPPSLYNEIPTAWPTPLAKSANEFITKRILLEQYNLRIWRDAEVSFGELDYFPPPAAVTTSSSTKHPSSAAFGQALIKKMTQELQSRAYV